MNKKTILIFGYGYTSSFLSSFLIKEGWSVFATTRDEENFSKIKKNGAYPILFSDRKEIEKTISKGVYVLSSIPPAKGGDPVLKEYSSLISEKKEFIFWLGYFSTTSIYGDKMGGWVTEETVPNPNLPRSIERLKVENSWKGLSKDTDISLNIFRLSGIYGPGRSLVDRFHAGENIIVVDRPNQLFNRVHVIDIVAITYLAMKKKFKNEIFNVSDDSPASQVEVSEFARTLSCSPPIKKVSLESDLISDMAKSFYLEEKKVSNKFVKKKLGYAFKFPSFSEGLRDIYEKL